MKTSFEMALAALKSGKMVTRDAWQYKKGLRLHKMAGTEGVWIVEPRKRTTKWTRVERLKIEDVMANDWTVIK